VSLLQRTRQELLRATKSPFTSRTDRPLLVHCGHHKSGTVWFREVLRSVADPYGLRFQEVDHAREPIRSRTDLAFYSQSVNFNRDQLGDRPFRGTHMIRDPRDLAVSGYEYHLVTSEEWVREPHPKLGRSYQDHLRSLSEHDGLIFEIKWQTSQTAAVMGQWDYDQPEFLELRYEDAIANEVETFTKMFRWYGLNDTATGLGLEAADRLSLKRGGARSSHARSGAPGEWRQRLAPDHLALLNELAGDHLIRLGYE
jgi:hypothetical protein